MNEAIYTLSARSGKSDSVTLPERFMRLLHLSDRGKIEVTQRKDGCLILKPMPEWSLKNQADSFAKAFAILDNLSDEEINKLPDGKTFENEYRIKWRDTSETDRKLDEML